MDSCFDDSCHGYEWQATFPGVLINFKNKILSVSNATVKTDPLPKTLTTEASCMICVLLCFIIFSAAGTSITILEYFYKKNVTRDEKEAKKTTDAEKNVKSFEYSAGNGLLNRTKKFFGCFCFITNARKILFRITPSERDDVSCVHGIRVMNFCWVIFSHTCMLYIGSIKNLEDQGPFLRAWFIQAILKGDYANDAYFTLGGFLNAFSFIQDYKKKRGNISWLRFYIKRIVRIAPLYMIILSFYTTLFSYLGSGPVWPSYSTNPVCKNNWWWNFLFINNFQTAESQCMIWTWYLATDFQFYSVSPLFMIPLYRWPKGGYILAGVFIFGSCLSNFLITKSCNLTSDIFRVGFHLSDIEGFLKRTLEIFNNLIERPYTRLTSYLVGILLGYYLGSTRRGVAVRRNSVFLYCGWIFTSIFMWICFSALGNAEESLINFAVFNATRHLLFSCVIAWLIFVCSSGRAEIVNRCLSMHGFVVLSRLSYGAYLINFLVLKYHFFRLTELGEFSFAYVVIMNACVLICTLVASFLLSAVIEMPVTRVYSMLPRSRKNE